MFEQGPVVSEKVVVVTIENESIGRGAILGSLEIDTVVKQTAGADG